MTNYLKSFKKSQKIALALFMPILSGQLAELPPTLLMALSGTNTFSLAFSGLMWSQLNLMQI
jgi:hypothetical protein